MGMMFVFLVHFQLQDVSTLIYPPQLTLLQPARECVVHTVTPKHCRLGLRRDRKMRRWTWPKDWLSLSAGSQAENGRRPGTMLELRNRHLDLSIRPHQDSLQWVERSRSSLVLWVYAVDRIAHQWRRLVVDEWWTACPWYLLSELPGGTVVGTTVQMLKSDTDV